MSSTLTSSLSRLLLLAAVGVLASCGGSSLTSNSGGGNVGSGSGSGGGGGSLQFSMGDLNGDWTGELIPDDRQLIRKNFYMRVVNGVVTETAEGGGGEWKGADASIAMDFTSQGFLDVAAESIIGKGDISLEGTMNPAMNTINGTVRVMEENGSIFEGTFELRRSTGDGHFTIDLVQGDWQGQGSNSRDKFRITTIVIDTLGVVQSAEMIHPVTEAQVHTYSVGAGVLEFVDSSIGRMDNVVLTGDDGSTLTFDFLLVNDNGTLITGPGVDSLLGEGRIELTH